MRSINGRRIAFSVAEIKTASQQSNLVYERNCSGGSMTEAKV